MYLIHHVTSGILPKKFVDVEKDEVHLTLKEKCQKGERGINILKLCFRLLIRYVSGHKGRMKTYHSSQNRSCTCVTDFYSYVMWKAAEIRYFQWETKSLQLLGKPNITFSVFKQKIKKGHTRVEISPVVFLRFKLITPVFVCEGRLLLVI